MKRRILGLALFVILGSTYLINRQIIDDSISRWVNFSFCDRPIKYSVGNIDNRFNITQTAFLEQIDSATKIWEKVVEKDLYEYDPNGDLEINLVYNERHELLKAIYQIETTVYEQKADIETTNSQYEITKQKLEKEIEELNSQIDYWNDKGGAPKEVYAKLNAQQNELKAKIDALNSMAANINNKVTKINSGINTLNSKVDYFNTLTQVHPEMGLYTSGINKIEIFFYGSEKDLQHVLAHELGHASGLEHVQQADAIMNPITSENTIATSEDIAEIKLLCEQKNRLDIIKSDVQNYLYTVLSNYYATSK